MSVSSPLVGVLLVGETQTSRGHVIGTAYLPTVSRSQTLKQLRDTLLPTLPADFKEKPYLFLTPQGWKISRCLEESVLAADVLDQDTCVRIQVDYARPRIGIVAEWERSEGRDVPLGFVFCELSASLRDLATQIMQDLVPSYPVRSPAQFSFLDRNGWPIASGQEAHFAVLDVIGDHTVRIRYNRHPGDTPLTTSSVQRLSIIRPSTPPTTGRPRQLQGVPALEPAVGGEGGVTLGAGNKAGEILISYVHSEATLHATALKRALQSEGYSVFLDVDSIAGGADWQDSLNEAIGRCSLFVALVTLRYGYTLWTNREVKLADILGKIIVPVNFLANWPPSCLAIQFATTQYAQWEQPFDANDPSNSAEVSNSNNDKASPGNPCGQAAIGVARTIIQRYQKELLSTAQVSPLEEVDGNEPHHLTPTSPSGVAAKPPVKSCPSLLPNSVPKDYQDIIQQPRGGRPLVVIMCHPAQRELASTVSEALEGDGCEVWCTREDDHSPASQETRAKINEAGVVVIMFSEEFVKCCKCQARVFYSEQRKRIVPLLVGSVCLPDWAAMLVGTNVFVDSRALGFVSTILGKVRAALNPRALEHEQAEAARQKEELDTLCTDLAQKLPKGKLVYISGGTNFYSPSGESICIELGMQLAKEKGVVLATGGFYGVGETVAKSFYDERVRLGEPKGVCHIVAVRDDQDKSHQTRQRSDGTFEAVPYGTTLFYGSSVRQREMLIPRLLDLCVLIEGGPGAAFEVQQFDWNEKHVIPVVVTGGAASGLFQVPPSVFRRPWGVCESDWSLLSDRGAVPRDVATAIVNIVRALSLPWSSEGKGSLGRADTELILCEESAATATIGRKRSYLESH